MNYKGYEIKEEVLDWILELVILNGWDMSYQEELTKEVHEIKRIGNYIGFRRSLSEENASTPRREPCKNGLYL